MFNETNKAGEPKTFTTELLSGCSFPSAPLLLPLPGSDDAPVSSAAPLPEHLRLHPPLAPPSLPTTNDHLPCGNKD